jgi:hypothetical protein
MAASREVCVEVMGVKLPEAVARAASWVPKSCGAGHRRRARGLALAGDTAEYPQRTGRAAAQVASAYEGGPRVRTERRSSRDFGVRKVPVDTLMPVESMVMLAPLAEI